MKQIEYLSNNVFEEIGGNKQISKDILLHVSSYTANKDLSQANFEITRAQQKN